MTVGNKTTEKINPKINGTAMTRMFNLRNIFELVNNGHWFSLIIGLKTLPDKGLTENTKLKEFFPS